MLPSASRGDASDLLTRRLKWRISKNPFQGGVDVGRDRVTPSACVPGRVGSARTRIARTGRRPTRTATSITPRKPAMVRPTGTRNRPAPESASSPTADVRLDAPCVSTAVRDGCCWSGYSDQSLLTPAGVVLVGVAFPARVLPANAGATAEQNSATLARTILAARNRRALAAATSNPPGTIARFRVD